MNERRRACIALGSNLGNRAATIEAAIDALRASGNLDVVAVSSLHETEPVGPPGQGRYLNAAAVIETTLLPRAVLEVLLAIEKQLGRVRDPQQRWGPRAIDLDLLLYGEEVVNELGLKVPHPRMHERLFVLDPLSEIAGAMLHPTLGQRVHILRDELAARQPSTTE